MTNITKKNQAISNLFIYSTKVVKKLPYKLKYDLQK